MPEPGVIARWPAETATAGDVNLQLTFSLPAAWDLDGVTIEAAAGTTPGAPPAARFPATIDGHNVRIPLTGADAARLRPGMTVDVRIATPYRHTIFRIARLNVRRPIG
jgi:hypothetical protein